MPVILEERRNVVGTSSPLRPNGANYGGQAEMAWAHAKIARDNIAIALSDMVQMEYIGLDEAKEIARAWMFDNPNEFFRLGLKA